MSSLASYTQAIKSTLSASLCLREFPSEIVEKHIKPEIEVYDTNKKAKHVISAPIVISRNEKEKCLIEGSINSVRVRKIQQKPLNLLPLFSSLQSTHHRSVWASSKTTISII
eukprot:TRINITY_DN1440_c0_g1_i9.p2 TRINITY_DN1440_c0_g1~~TRINITY_DN1440_c0_g1_i9.p2  ORF type:complete len:112 (-),score=18.16 TRINITY_DN1440_c0_g1_i9:513-848(-)